MPSEYDTLAWFYDKYWGPRYHDAAAGVLETLLYREVAVGSRVLDLCCGSGHLSERLVERGYRVCGVDGSLDMLRCARDRVPSAMLACADASAMPVAQSCRAAVSTFDSLNHVLNDADLERVFRGVVTALHPGSPFVFDINTAESYGPEWDRSFASVEDDSVLIVRGGYDPVRRIGATHITTFRRIGAWHRADVNIEQRPLEPSQVASLLEAAGFSDVAAVQAEDAGMTGSIATGRVFMRARRR